MTHDNLSRTQDACCAGCTQWTMDNLPQHKLQSGSNSRRVCQFYELSQMFSIHRILQKHLKCAFDNHYYHDPPAQSHSSEPMSEKFLGIVGQYPSDSKPNQLHVDIFQFCLIYLRYILQIPLEWYTLNSVISTSIISLTLEYCDILRNGCS